jgi:FMN phosphatase YigB (HAD superfamily)
VDKTLKRLAAAIEDRSVDLVSVDVFDTLLWRKAPYPTDVFHLLGRRLRELRMVGPEVAPEVFGHLREEAERRARARRSARDDGPEVRLAEIYQEFPRWLFTTFGPEEFMEQELALEAELTEPNLDLVPLLEHATALGIPVVAVSDTYFSEGHLRRLLDRPAYAGLKLSAVYTSSDHRTNKGMELYQLVLQDFDVPAGRVLHVGDNRDADETAARRAGLQTLYAPRLSADFMSVLEEELRIVKQVNGSHASALDTTRGDHGLTWLRGKGHTRNAYVKWPVGLQPFWLYGYEILGPVLTLFSEWLAHQAVTRDIRVLHGVMREGSFLSELVTNTAGHHGLPLESRTIWLSRSVCTRANVFEGSLEELRALVSRRAALTLGDFCASIDIPVQRLGPFSDLGSRRLDDPRLVEELLQHIVSRPELTETVVSGAQRLRNRLLEYLLANAEDGRMVLVDLGWNLTIQWGVQHLLNWFGDPIELEGLYLMTTEGARERILDGCRADSYLGRSGVPERFVRRFIRSPEILEQVCLVDAGSCIGYDERLEPVLDHQRIRPLQLTQCEAAREGVREFQRQWFRYGLRGSVERAHSPAVTELLRATLERSVVSPTADEARTFSQWEHDSNFGSGDVEKLFDERSALLMRYGDPGTVSRMGMSEIYWPSGAAALFNPAFGPALAAVEDGLIEAEVLGGPAPTGNVDLFWDTGRGFTADQRAELRTRVNGSGLALASGGCSAEGIVAIRLDPAVRPAVFRVDHLWVDVVSRDRPGITRIAFRNSNELSRLIAVNCTALAPSVFLSNGPDPQLVLALDPQEFGNVYKVEVGLCFAAISLPEGRVEAGPQSTRLQRALLRMIRS